MGPNKWQEMTTQWTKDYENSLAPTNKSSSNTSSQHHVGGPRLLVAVADTGAGMNAEQLLHLFNAFYQADSTTTKRHEGTGLGLAISKSLV